MSILIILVPVTFALGLTALAAFLWNLRSGQYEDLSGAAERVLLDDEDVPGPPAARGRPREPQSGKEAE